MSGEQINKTLDQVQKLYTKNYKTFGSISKSVGWKDQKSQNIRFQKLSQVVMPSKTNDAITVSDWGCGYGAMFKYLDHIPNIRLKKYFGYDISTDMLSAAEEYINDDRAKLILSPDLIFESDYIFVSGTFNVKFKAGNTIWLKFIKETLMNISEKSRIGFAFNLLSTYVDWKEKHLYYGDPLLFFDFCKKNISRYVSLLHDYPLYEWTILIRKEK